MTKLLPSVEYKVILVADMEYYRKLGEMKGKQLLVTSDNFLSINMGNKKE